MTTTRFDSMIQEAHANLTASYPRAGYAHDVLSGRQWWSGADLQGAARNYGGHYAEQRKHAAWALHDAGGVILPVEHGRLVTALPIGMDDFGNAVYETRRGMYLAPVKCNALRV